MDLRRASEVWLLGNLLCGFYDCRKVDKSILTEKSAAFITSANDNLVLISQGTMKTSGRPSE